MIHDDDDDGDCTGFDSIPGLSRFRHHTHTHTHNRLIDNSLSYGITANICTL